VIEVDGDIHLCEKNIEYDDSRTGELERFGLKVIRFKNEEIMNDLERVISEIKIIIVDLSSSSLLGKGDRRG
jgi:very-short-patch-repair endonuclease